MFLQQALPILPLLKSTKEHLSYSGMPMLVPLAQNHTCGTNHAKAWVRRHCHSIKGFTTVPLKASFTCAFNLWFQLERCDCLTACQNHAFCINKILLPISESHLDPDLFREKWMKAIVKVELHFWWHWSWNIYLRTRSYQNRGAQCWKRYCG
jgi:hypothetical protein